MSDAGTTGSSPSNVAALIDALDERARQAGSEGATAVLRGILGSVAEVLNGIESRLGQIEDRMRYGEADDGVATAAAEMQAALGAVNARLGRLEDAFARAVEDSGSGTETVIQQLRTVVEAAVRDEVSALSGQVNQIADVRDQVMGLAGQLGHVAQGAGERDDIRALATQVAQLADMSQDVSALSFQLGQLADMRDDVRGLATQVAQLADVRDEVRALFTQLDQLADVRDILTSLSGQVGQLADTRDQAGVPGAQLGDLTDVREQLTEVNGHLGLLALMRAELRALSSRFEEVADIAAEVAETTQQGVSAPAHLAAADGTHIADVRAQVDQLSVELVAQFADVRDRLADVADTVADLTASVASAGPLPATADALSAPAPGVAPDALSEMAAEVRELAAAVDDLREELTQQEDRRGSESGSGAGHGEGAAGDAEGGDAGGDAGSSTLEATAMLAAQVADLSAVIRTQNDVVAELRAVSVGLRDLPQTLQPPASDAALQGSIEALRADVTAALHRTETSVLESVTSPRPRRRLLPLLALLVALASIGFSLLPFSGAGGVDCDPPLLVANPDIRATAGYPDPDPDCESLGNTRLMGSAAVAFLAVVIGTFGVAVPPRRRAPKPRRGAHSPARK